jgi:hypothetical protein
MTKPKPNIRIDQTPAQTLAYCTACPSWRHLRDTRTAAEALGVRHLADVHPDVAGNTPFDRARQQREAKK